MLLIIVKCNVSLNKETVIQLIYHLHDFFVFVIQKCNKRVTFAFLFFRANRVILRRAQGLILSEVFGNQNFAIIRK